MANLIESAVFDSGIYRLETLDAVVGGETGISNKQAKSLGNRTLYLKQHLDAAATAITTQGTAVADHTTKLNALTASRLVSDGINFSKGQLAITSGSPYDIPADAVGKFIRIVPNGNSITVRVPALAGVNIGSAFFISFNDTTGLYLAFKALISSVDGTIVGDVENFRNGDSLIIEKYDATTWQLFVLNKSNTEEPGTIKYFATATPPAGYIAANGAAISRTTYARLFAVIGVQNGVGDGTTTFNIPDGRGVVIRGWDNGRGLDPSRVFGSYQADELKSHNHQGGGEGIGNTYGGGSLTGNRTYPPGPGASYFNANTSSTGGSETRGKNIALLACIKY